MVLPLNSILRVREKWTPLSMSVTGGWVWGGDPGDLSTGMLRRVAV